MKSYSNDKQFIAKLKSIELLIKQNQLQDAVLQLNLLGKTAPHDPRLFLLGAQLADVSGNADGVLQAARKAQQLAPQWSTASLYLATVLAGRGEAEEAMSMAALAVQQTDVPTTQPTHAVELLAQAADIALRLNLSDQALLWLRQAEKISPDDFGVRYKIARAMSASGDALKAIGIFTDLLLQQPSNPALLSARMQASLSAQQTESAIRDGEALMALQPESALHPYYLAIARGETPKTQPAEVVASLFDSYATQYDRLWVVQLHYQLPRDVAQMIHQWHPDREEDVLDLGCGTGLLGACLGPINGLLVGVDLSVEMLKLASRHHVYDSFRHVNLTDALTATPNDQYHIIAALDVLGYVGDLEPVIANAYRILLPGGRFIFSCECGVEGGADYSLQPTYRYQHQRPYLERLLVEAGFEEINIEERVLRFDSDQPVQGFLVTARKQALAVKKVVRRVTKSTKPPKSQE